MRILRIKNYEKYQNHRAKDPRWVKLYRSVLTDHAFLKLDPTSRYIYLGLLILASETGNSIVNDVTYLCHRLAIPAPQLDLKPLICSGLIVASLRTIQRQKSVSETEAEKSREETEGETAQAPPSPTVVPLTKEKKRPGPLPEDFKFSPELRDWALAKGCKEPFAEFERFCTKAVSKGWVYTDWSKAYQNWVLNELKWAREKNHAAV